MSRIGQPSYRSSSTATARLVVCAAQGCWPLYEADDDVVMIQQRHDCKQHHQLNQNTQQQYHQHLEFFFHLNAQLLTANVCLCLPESNKNNILLGLPLHLLSCSWCCPNNAQKTQTFFFLQLPALTMTFPSLCAG